ncbi:MAG: glycosyl transferase group 1 [Geobacter sp.]|nr:MAG: glycosyl transferase group 1 [Geobacter sp.]
MIKIAFIIDMIESPTAGTEKQLLLLIKHLDRSRFQPYLCVLRTSEWLEKEFDACPVFVVKMDSFKSIKGLKGLFVLSKYLKDKGVDIVQTHFRDSSIAGILAAKLAGIKVVIGTRRNQGYWLTPFELKIQKNLDRWVTIYIANSQSTKQWLINNEGVDHRRVEVVNNGFDISLFPSNTYAFKCQMRKSLGIPEHAPVIVIVANLRPVKDHETFLRAAQIVLCYRPDSRFLVVGSGPELSKLKTLSSELGIAKAINYLGARLDIPDILVACDIGVLSSTSESFSNALVEYMASGLPVVTTDVGGAREAVDDGVNGFIVPIRNWDEMGKRIANLLESGRAAEMGQESCRRSKERFSLATMIQKSEQLYSSVYRR